MHPTDIEDDVCANPVINSQVKQAISAIENGCLDAYRLQLRSWLMYHRIVDPHGEFPLKIGDDGKAVFDPERELPSWMLPEHVEDLLLAGDILDKLRQRRQSSLDSQLSELVDAVVFADSSLAVDLAVDKLRNEAVRSIGALVGVDAMKQLMFKIRAITLLGDGLLWDRYLDNLKGPFDLMASRRASIAAGLSGASMEEYDDIIGPKLQPEWPLSEILRPRDEAQYAKIFSTLLPVRSALLKLRTSWISLHKRGNLR